MINFQIPEVVCASTNIEKIPLGTIGTVVHKYNDNKYYEVEFIVNGKSVVKTVSDQQIEKK